MPQCFAQLSDPHLSSLADVPSPGYKISTGPPPALNFSRVSSLDKPNAASPSFTNFGTAPELLDKTALSRILAYSSQPLSSP